MSSIILAKLIKKPKLQTIEKVKEPDNVEGVNVKNFVIELEADKFILLFDKVFEEKQTEEKNVTYYLDAEEGTFQEILEKNCL